MKKDNKGFTLVELLAVIVILAIIMLIAIPSVLNVMTTAKRQAFKEYIDKVALATQNKYTESQLYNNVTPSVVIYDIEKDLGLTSTGDYKGFTLVDSNKDIYVTLYDKEFAVSGLKWSDIDNASVVSVVSVSSTEFTKEGLATVVGVSDYSYYEDGELKTGEVILKKAIMTSGSVFNTYIKRLANDESFSASSADRKIKHVKFTRNISSAPDSKVSVSDVTSEKRIYVWWEESTETIYIGCENNMIYLSKDASYMFHYLFNVEDIDFSHFISDDTSSLYRFVSGCFKLKSVDLKHFNTSKVTNFRAVFLDCAEITSLDLSTWNTSNAIEIGYMFSGTTNLKSLDISNFNTSGVTRMENLFQKSGLKEIHIESFDTSKVKDMSYSFGQAPNLERIYVSSKFTIDAIANTSPLFTGSTKLQNFDSSKVSKEYWTLYMTVV
ncbi:MAG: DUF285 domain-containing protein [Bacilli bacterium]|nr:DUF285 domain-containing protein [Bacilli bacterium]